MLSLAECLSRLLCVFSCEAYAWIDWSCVPGAEGSFEELARTELCKLAISCYDQLSFEDLQRHALAVLGFRSVIYFVLCSYLLHCHACILQLPFGISAVKPEDKINI